MKENEFDLDFDFEKEYGFDLTEEDHAVLLKILSEGVWAEGTADIDSHYYLMAEPNGKLMYSKNGIFSDMGQSTVQKRHLVLTDRQRDTVNGILEKYTKENEEVILYRTDRTGSLDELYSWVYRTRERANCKFAILGCFVVCAKIRA